jgi:toxin ParE1/3/4
MQALSESPLIGRARNELINGIRSFPVGNYLLFYQQIENGIEIIRVLHGSRDIETILTK